MARNKLGNNNEHTKTGTNGDDIISGVGGSFNLIGGKGNDIYIVDDSGDTIDEKNNGGTDHVISYVDFVLGKHIEDLTLAGEARLGTGNDSDNTITGNSNGNILDGQGGDDTLIGGDGADFIDGGDGIDTAVFTGLSSDYLVERDGLDLLVTLGGVTDVLRNVEYLSFDDGVIAVSDIGDQPGDLPAPQAIDDAGSGVEDGSVVITVLGNDIGDGILVTSTTNGTKGLVTVNEDGTVTYQPVADANGTDNFNYTITDSLGRTSTATVTVDITSLNDAPIANPDRYATIAGALFTSDVSVLDNDSDPDGDQLMVTPFQGASQAGGSVTMSADGTFTYSSAAGFVGTDTFTYTIDDGNGGQATATVSIDVAGGNSVPIAVNDTYQAISGEVFVSGGSVLDNDSDPDGDILTIVASDVTSQSGGSVEMNADGSFTYTPASDFTGTDWFNYTIDDGNGGQATASATVTLNVTPPPEDPPVEDPPEYISGLLLAEDQRHNYPDDYGTGTVITYSFLAGVPDYYESDHWARDGFQSFTAAQQDATREMLALVESYTDITFVETSDVDAAITFGIADLPHGRGLTWLPEADSVGKKAGDVWIDFLTAGTDFVPGSSAWQTVLHEIGHTLGLDHPDYMDASNETTQYTVTAYLPHQFMDPDPETFQLYDIAALQYIYGTNSTHNTGDNTYTSDMLDNRVLTIWDAGGNDRIDLSDLSHDAIVNLNEGAFSTVTTPDDYARGLYNIAIAFGTVIEDVTGSNFNDILIGNDVSNRIEGGAGSDELTGGAGADLFVYGVEWGNDTISDFVSGEDALDLTGSGLTREEIEITYGSTGATLSSSEGSIFMAGVTMIEEGDLFFDSLV